MEGGMRVSVVIPLFNQAQFVAQTIESCLAQTHQDTEIIVVNDGSTDESRMVALRYPVRVIDQSNKGLAGARNAGIMNSTGDFILPLDSDDWIDPHYIEKTLPLMQRSVGIVSTDFDTFGEQVQYIRTIAPTLWEEMQCNHLPVCSLIRKRAILETGGYNQHCAKYEDWNMWIDLLKRGWGVEVLHEPLFHYRVRTGSMVTGCTADEHARLWAVIKTLHPDLY